MEILPHKIREFDRIHEIKTRFSMDKISSPRKTKAHFKDDFLNHCL